jgi:hypothetical protein
LGAGNEKAVGAKGPRRRRKGENCKKDGGQHTNRCLEHTSPWSALSANGVGIHNGLGALVAPRNRSR